MQDKKNVVICLLTALYIIKAPQAGLRFVLWAVAGAVSCVFFDWLINRIFLKKRIFPRSAFISGLIVSGILDYEQPIFILLIFTLTAIASKHILKFRGRHIFNPANFALFSATLFRFPLTWNIESNIYLIVAAGVYIAYSIKKIPHIIGFLIFFSAPLLIMGLNPFNLIGWFFIFIMLIEPRTSGFGSLRGFIFGGVAGISAFLIFRFLPRYDMLVFSLFVANLFRPVLERIKE